ncbi:thioredoxin reductase 1-related [Anaeramoeba ignava]|uniref:Thioredoxin reductase n=1 Tax=Anaeramoeba ignava TaxID=1746090 RepID=A0A9Q0RHH9_ANAIG|nr:thioredoxin reductase 1-related [Anaeramoeba ignava]|eukprot:Anaeramoba_ignava/a3399_197.p1 GENE.a3399_197~~a3399_197.p1  ORF type:complete len:338 (-),score=114.27 a3399_197:248-1237(-)
MEVQKVDKVSYDIDPKLDFSKAEHRKVIIIGSGPAGCTAGIYTARADLKPLLIRGNDPGGQLVRTTDIENYAGFIGTGPELMMKMDEQAQEQGCELIFGEVIAVDFSVRPFKLVLFPDICYTADSVIIATGASAKYLGLESEQKYMNKGVSGCATCDGPLYRNKIVSVVGGGDVAIEDALFLSRFCKEVHVIHRRRELRASKPMQKRAFENPKIIFEWDSVVDEILGDGEFVNGVMLKDVKTNEKRKLVCAGVFMAIGHKPNTDVFKKYIETDEVGYIITKNGKSHTNVEGVFCCGDAQDKEYRQAITAAGSGCKAALDCERWLATQQI